VWHECGTQSGDHPIPAEQSARSVYIGAVLDAHHPHNRAFVDHAVDDPVRASASGSIARELAPERPSDPLRVLQERTDEELHDCDCNALG